MVRVRHVDWRCRWCPAMGGSGGSVRGHHDGLRPCRDRKGRDQQPGLHQQPGQQANPDPAMCPDHSGLPRTGKSHDKTCLYNTHGGHKEKHFSVCWRGCDRTGSCFTHVCVSGHVPTGAMHIMKAFLAKPVETAARRTSVYQQPVCRQASSGSACARSPSFPQSRRHRHCP